MRLSPESVDRAIEFLRFPREAHELADYLFPDRVDRDLTARRRSGHSSGRDLIEQGLAVRQGDGRYVLAVQQPQEPIFEPPAEEGELEVEDGQVVRVRREVLGPVALPPPPPQARPQQSAHAFSPPPPPPPQQAAPQYAPPQQAPQPTREEIHQQYLRWNAATLPELRAINTLLAEVYDWRRSDGTWLDEWEHERARQESSDRLRAYMVDVYWWFRRLGGDPWPSLERLSAPPSPPPRAPTRSPSPRSPRASYAPSW